MGAARKLSPSRTTSATSSAGPKPSLSTTLKAQVYLGPLLPTGWEHYFSSRGAGRYYGLNIKCALCGKQPPEELSCYQKWRYLAVHATQHRRPKRLK